MLKFFTVLTILVQLATGASLAFAAEPVCPRVSLTGTLQGLKCTELTLAGRELFKSCHRVLKISDKNSPYQVCKGTSLQLSGSTVASTVDCKAAIELADPNNLLKDKSDGATVTVDVLCSEVVQVD